jgi:hypothetical protein
MPFLKPRNLWRNLSVMYGRTQQTNHHSNNINTKGEITMFDNISIRGLLRLIIILILALIALGLVLAILKMIMPLIIVGLLIAGGIYLYKKLQTNGALS